MIQVALLVAVFAVQVADLPPGAVMRIGDARWRAGDSISRIVLSPDGKQFATVRMSTFGLDMVTVWDTDSGRPLRSVEVNEDLFKGIAWGPGGAFLIVRRAELAKPGEKTGEHVPNDFRVWAFADPKAAPPPLLPVFVGFGEITV